LDVGRAETTAGDDTMDVGVLGATVATATVDEGADVDAGRSQARKHTAQATPSSPASPRCRLPRPIATAR